MSLMIMIAGYYSNDRSSNHPDQKTRSGIRTMEKSQ